LPGKDDAAIVDGIIKSRDDTEAAISEQLLRPMLEASPAQERRSAETRPR